MNKYLLDTNICVFYFRENKNIRVKIEEIGIESTLCPYSGVEV